MRALIADLTSAFRQDPVGAGVASLLAAYAVAHDDWRPFALSDPERYTRNLLEVNDLYELMVLHWSEGQRSPIHNHEGQNCWMAVLEGPVEEASFAFPNGTGAPSPGPVKSYNAGQVAYIRDEVGLHEVRTVEGYHAVSLHLYSKPYQECSCYCPDTGAITRTTLSYYSVRGERS